MKIISFGLDNRALLDSEGHSKRWNTKIGAYLDSLDIIVEMNIKTRLEQKMLTSKVRIIPLYVPHPILYPYLAYRKALEEHKKNRYDLAISDDAFRSGLAAALFKNKAGVAYALEYHTGCIGNKEWLRERFITHNIYQIIARYVIKSADSIRFVNQKNLSQLVQFDRSILNKITEIIPVPTAFYNPSKNSARANEIRKSIVKDDNDIVILFVGRLVPVKKVDELIDIFSEIKDEYNNVHLLIVGDGVERDKLMRLATQKCGNERITFTGYVSEEDIFNYYGACDFFVNPAHVETYGRVYTEALSAAKPIVCTTGSGAVDDKFLVHEKNALVVSPGNRAKLKESIIRLIDDKMLRQELGERGLVAAKQKFDYETSMKNMVNFWGQTILKAKKK